MATRIETFNLFPRLPTELRLMIWDRALPKFRFIVNDEPDGDPYVDDIYDMPLAQVNREARSRVLQHYQWCEMSGLIHKGFFFNGKTDILYHTPSDCDIDRDFEFDFDHRETQPKWYEDHPESAKEVKQACVPRKVMEWMQTFNLPSCVCDAFLEYSSHFPSLEKLWLWDTDVFDQADWEDVVLDDIDLNLVCYRKGDTITCLKCGKSQKPRERR